MDQFINDNLPIIAATLVVLADVAVVSIFTNLKNKFQKLKTNGIKTEGKVVSVQSVNKGTLVVYSFSDYRGSQIEARSMMQNVDSSTVVGADIDITYDKDNSKNSAVTDTIDQQLGIFSILVKVVIGMAFIIPPVIYFVLSTQFTK